MQIIKNIKEYLREKKESKMSLEELFEYRYNNDKYADKWRNSEVVNFINFRKGYIKKFLETLIGADLDRKNLDVLIHNYTLADKCRDEDFEIVKKYTIALSEGYIEAIKHDDNVMLIKTKDGVTEVYKMSSFIEFDDHTMAELETEERGGNCHHRSMWLSKKFDNGECNVVTSRISQTGPLGEILHTWIEVSMDEKEVCMDYTLNAIIDKESYYRIMDIKPDTVSRISNTMIIEDEEKFQQLYRYNPWFTKMYLMDRDDAMAWHDKLSEEFEEVM